MGYTKIVQYGNVNEVYQYQNDYKKRNNQTHLKHQRLLHGHEKSHYSSLTEKRRKALLAHKKKNFSYSRSKASANRALKNFFRLCHHNNVNSKSIHFLTLTFSHDLTYKKALEYQRRFMEKITDACEGIPVRYISVPETTEAGRFHFHLLVYDLPSKVAGNPISVRRFNKKSREWEVVETTTERFTRNLQVMFRAGYVDIMPTTYTSRGIAGYMAKYMAKALTDSKYQATRGYNCSRNIAKIYCAGSNTHDKFLDLILPTENLLENNESSYNVPYMGTCKFRKIVKII